MSGDSILYVGDHIYTDAALAKLNFRCCGPGCTSWLSPLALPVSLNLLRSCCLLACHQLLGLQPGGSSR